ncbi:serine hydrolase domain-containing protein [Tellurirhabdus bombi]|uniref:serine hydrolase domain-containing protein n=1 Tax=Tellurirhabdus bombi TaxID=2907205 RepID=UPI001F27DFDB|nr:serine hydrolase domain-containing protein [Tellurirhabdus bombi]
MKSVVLAISLLCATLSAYAQSLKTELDSVMSRHFPAKSPGGALFVQIDGKIIYQKGYGSANLAKATGVTPATNFRMASVSKQFTAMCILLLEKQKKLSVEDNLLRFFPDFNSKVGQKVTLRHLLTHRSGLVDYETLLPPKRKNQIFDAEVVQLLKPLDSTYFEPGTSFRYSNSAFCVLEQVVEKVSGQPYLSFIRQTIFDPLGMKQTTLYDPPKGIIPNRAMGYAPGEKEDEVVPADQSVTSGTKGDGCIYTSLIDYQKWCKALEDNTLLDLTAAFERISYPIENTEQASYGLGWFQYHPDENTAEYFHSGSTSGFSTFVVRVPAKKTTIVLFSNLADNTAPFEEVLTTIRVASETAPLIDVWALHDLTQ